MLIRRVACVNFVLFGSFASSFHTPSLKYPWHRNQAFARHLPSLNQQDCRTPWICKAVSKFETNIIDTTNLKRRLFIIFVFIGAILPQQTPVKAEQAGIILITSDSGHYFVENLNIHDEAGAPCYEFFR